MLSVTSLEDVDWPVSTARLSLRRAAPADAATTFAYRSLPDVAEWLTSHPRDEAAWARQFLESERLAVTVVVERDGVVVGDLMLRLEDAWSQTEAVASTVSVEAELGWVIAPGHQGRGLAREAAAALVETCFGPLHLRRVTAVCFADNEPSWRMMERLGMRRESAMRRDALHRSRGWLDTFAYALLAEEWPALR